MRLPSTSRSKRSEKLRQRANQKRVQAPSKQYRSKSKQAQVSSNQHQPQQGIANRPGVDTTSLSGLVEDPDTTLEDKLQWLRALHAKWSFEDKEEAVDGTKLVFRQKTRCKDVGPIVFGFALHDGQIDVIWNR